MNEKIVVNDIACQAQKIYNINFFINLQNSKYDIEISCSNQAIKFTDIFIVEDSNKLDYVNRIVIIHENSYRYAITDLEYYCIG